jgi:GTP pyrophosphokinase
LAEERVIDAAEAARPPAQGDTPVPTSAESEGPAPATPETEYTGGPTTAGRMRARLARIGTKTTSSNPVLEPLFRAVKANHAKADLALLERAYLTAERCHAGQKR